MTTPLEDYYNKFNEDKRLSSRHGQVEFITSMKYIHDCLEDIARSRGCTDPHEIRILDVGAGTGRYSIPLSEEGYDVTAIELVKHNLGRIRMNGPLVTAYQGNALKLKRCQNESYDLTILFGPMYHLHTPEKRIQALKEALRVTRPGGYVLVAYIMNEYSVLVHGFRDRYILESREKGLIDDNFHVADLESELYAYLRMEDIAEINTRSGAHRKQIISADGPANYMRRELNALTQEEFELFIQYHLSTCERPELLGAAGHLVDILQK